jgi:putative addiction module component (TIGR02574 family)
MSALDSLGRVTILMMSAALKDVIAAAMSLPPEARAQLAEQLLDSLDPRRREVDAAWAAEIERRIQEIEDGRTQLIPHDEVMGSWR